MHKYTVRVLKMGEAEVPAPEVYWMSGWGEWERLFFYMVLIRGEDRTVVINTGPPADLADLNERWKTFAGPRCMLQRTENERPSEALKRAGVEPEQVTHVLLTPLQMYSTGNVTLFPNAQICFSRRGWIEEITAPLPWLHVPRRYCIDDVTMDYLLFKAQDRVRLLGDEEEICPGINASWVGTHHRSSTLYKVSTSKGIVGVSDCAFKYGNLKGHPLGIGESLEEGARAYARILGETQEFIPLYDPAVLEKYSDGMIA